MDTEKSCFCFAERKKKTLKNIYQSIDRLIDMSSLSRNNTNLMGHNDLMCVLCKVICDGKLP